MAEVAPVTTMLSLLVKLVMRTSVSLVASSVNLNWSLPALIEAGVVEFGPTTSIDCVTIAGPTWMLTVCDAVAPALSVTVTTKLSAPV